ncbi:hypothetical protein H8E77_24545 [bacterium]|nr:hypothetical protein [bacterium]
MTLSMDLERNKLTSLLERHRAFWMHKDMDEPLMRIYSHRQRRRPFENVDVTPDMLDIEMLTPEVGTRNMQNQLVQGDLFRCEHAFSRIPWMEAIVGCKIHSGIGEAMWPRPALGPNYEGMERIVPDDDNPWLMKLLDLTRALVEANDGSYLVTHTLQRGPIDILSALLGDVRMGLAFYDEPQKIEEILKRATQAFIKVAKAQYALIPSFEGGWVSWGYGLWAPGTVIRFQADSASQISPLMYQEQILPHELDIMRAFDYSIIDLHSGGTLHLHKVLIEVEELDAISVTIDPYESSPTIEDLLPVFAVILENKSLSISGEMKMEQIDCLRQTLPTGCLNINATITDKLLWERQV